MRERPSPKVTSRLWWEVFSIVQCARVASAARLAVTVVFETQNPSRARQLNFGLTEGWTALIRL